jgi:hypothetical protein
VPVNTVHQFLKSVLDGLIIPGEAGTLAAFISPPAVRDEPPPAIYLWSARGGEKRQSLPRAGTGYLPATQSGWKQIDHTVEGYLTWFGDNSDSQADVSFPAVIDCVMQALRSTTDPVYKAIDALTGQQSELFATGERMNYEMVPPRATADQRYFRYDALITINVSEAFQA